MGCGVILTICHTQDSLSRHPPHQPPSTVRPPDRLLPPSTFSQPIPPIEVQQQLSPRREVEKRSVSRLPSEIKQAQFGCQLEEAGELLEEIHLSMGSRPTIAAAQPDPPLLQDKQNTPQRKQEEISIHSSRKLITTLEHEQVRLVEKKSEKAISREQVRVESITAKIESPSLLPNINDSKEKKAADVVSVKTSIKSIPIPQAPTTPKLKRQSTARLHNPIEPPPKRPQENKAVQSNQTIKKTQITARKLSSRKQNNGSKKLIPNNLKSNRTLVPVDSLFLQSDVLNKPPSSNELDPYRQEVKLGSKDNKRPPVEKKISLQARKLLEEQRKEEKRRREAEEKKLKKVYNVSK